MIFHKHTLLQAQKVEISKHSSINFSFHPPPQSKCLNTYFDVYVQKA